MNCLNCQKELKQTEGKREKKYCNDHCRATYFQKRKQKKEISAKYVLKTRHEEIVEKLQSRINALEAQISAQGRSQVNHHKEPEMPPDQAKSTNTPIKPLRMDGENAVDYAFRVNEWKRSLKNQ